MSDVGSSQSGLHEPQSARPSRAEGPGEILACPHGRFSPERLCPHGCWSEEKDRDPRIKSRSELWVQRIDDDTVRVVFGASSGSDGLTTGGDETFKLPPVGGSREFKSEWPR